MVENYQNSDKNNKNTSIEIKKSLKRTIIQLEKAINIINQQSIKDLPNLTVVEKLLNSSNALVDYLQFRNSQIENTENLGQETIENDDTLSEINNKKNTINTNKKQNITTKKQKKNILNIILIFALIISLFSNLLIWWFKPNVVINSSDNKENNGQIESQTTEIIIDNPPTIDTIDNENIIKEENKTNNTEENNLLNDSNSPKIINNKSLENITENVSEAQEKIKDNNNILEEDLSLPLTPEQFLLKNIENQISDITNKYQKKLIIKIEANFTKNSLIITLSEDWYSLNDSQQNSLVKDILNKVKTLNFYKFNIQDINGQLLARNAVVGNEFIIIN
jgi:hypothetical protein